MGPKHRGEGALRYLPTLRRRALLLAWLALAALASLQLSSLVVDRLFPRYRNEIPVLAWAAATPSASLRPPAGEGATWTAAAPSVAQLPGAGPPLVLDLGAPVVAIARDGDGIVAATAGVGAFRIVACGGRLCATNLGLSGRDFTSIAAGRIG